MSRMRVDGSFEGLRSGASRGSGGAKVLLVCLVAAAWTALASAGTWLGAVVSASSPLFLSGSYWAGLCFVLATVGIAAVQHLRG